jgi:hypothetical protein
VEQLESGRFSNPSLLLLRRLARVYHVSSVPTRCARSRRTLPPGRARAPRRSTLRRAASPVPRERGRRAAWPRPFGDCRRNPVGDRRVPRAVFEHHRRRGTSSLARDGARGARMRRAGSAAGRSGQVRVPRVPRKPG